MTIQIKVASSIAKIHIGYRAAFLVNMSVDLQFYPNFLLYTTVRCWAKLGHTLKRVSIEKRNLVGRPVVIINIYLPSANLG